MAIDSKKLRNLFGNADDDKPKTKKDFFDDEDENNNTEFTNDDLEIEEDDDIIPPANIIKNTEALPITQQTMVADIDYALRTQADLVNQAQKLVQITLNNAAEGNARDGEVAAGAITTATDAVEKLVGLYEKIQKITNASQQNMGSGNTFVQNQVVYQGTTAETLKAIREGKI